MMGIQIQTAGLEGSDHRSGAQSLSPEDYIIVGGTKIGWAAISPFRILQLSCEGPNNIGEMSLKEYKGDDMQCGILRF